MVCISPRLPRIQTFTSGTCKVKPSYMSWTATIARFALWPGHQMVSAWHQLLMIKPLAFGTQKLEHVCTPCRGTRRRFALWPGHLMVSTSSLLRLIILSSYGTLRVALFLALWKDILIMFSAQRGLRTISLLPQLPGIALSAFGRCPVERK